MPRKKSISVSFMDTSPPSRSPFDKTADAARMITETDAQDRAERTAKLRARRLEQEALNDTQDTDGDDDRRSDD